MTDLIPIPTWWDFIDILFLTLVAYHLYMWFRETKALRVLISLVALGGIYSVAKLWGLFLTTWVFQILWQVLLILLLIVLLDLPFLSGIVVLLSRFPALVMLPEQFVVCHNRTAMLYAFARLCVSHYMPAVQANLLISAPAILLA